MMRRMPPSREELVTLYQRDRLSQRDIAAVKGVSARTVGGWLRRYGIPARPFRPIGKHAGTRPDGAALRADYERGISIRALSQRYDVSYGTAHRWLVEAGTELRRPGSGTRSTQPQARRTSTHRTRKGTEAP